MAYNPRTDIIKNRRDAANLRRQAREAADVRHRAVNPNYRNTYNSLIRSARALEAEAKRIEQQQRKK